MKCEKLVYYSQVAMISKALKCEFHIGKLGALLSCFTFDLE